MTFRIVENPSWADLQHYGAELYEAMQKLTDRFPHDMTVRGLLEELLRGEKRLWLILEEGRFVAFALTNIRTVEATGAKIAELVDLAGERVTEYAEPLFQALIDWSDREGATVDAVTGRDGWRKLLGKYGFKVYAVTYRREKDVKHNENHDRKQAA